MKNITNITRQELQTLAESVLNTFCLAHNIKPCGEVEIYPNMKITFKDNTELNNIEVLEVHGFTTTDTNSDELYQAFETYVKAYNSSVPEFSKFVPYDFKVFKNKNITSVYVSLFY